MNAKPSKPAAAGLAFRSADSLLKSFLCLLLAAKVLGWTPPVARASTERLEPIDERPDKWIGTSAQFPPGIPAGGVQAGCFSNLHAEVCAARLKILWSPEVPITNAAVTLHASADDPGHWPARDWRPCRMSLHAQSWEVFVPVSDVDVPLVYFVTAVENDAIGRLNRIPTVAVTNISPMRICKPRSAGLEEATRVFWPFLEGFEQDTASWRLISDPEESAPLTTGSPARNGLSALAVTLPAGKRSVTLATTRVRGWQLMQNGATGVHLWLRAGKGTGRARFTLLANASTADQVVSIWPKETIVTEAWQPVKLSLSDLPKLPVAGVDLFAIELIGDGPMEFLLDDLELLGPWPMELD
jgi:hypothetical protein